MKTSQYPPFTPEQEVLLWAIRVDHSKDQRVAEILKSGVDWGYIRETAIQHGIIPLLYKRMKGEMADFVPVDELSTLRTLFVANAANNIRMTQHLLEVLDLLANSGLEAMPFKGPVLAVQAYGDLSMRSYGDLDILIHANDLSRINLTLTEQGYVPKDFSEVNLTLTEQGYFLNNPFQTSIMKILRIIHQKDLHFFFRDDVLEFHWKISERFYAVPFNMDHIWDRSLPIFINNQKIQTLSSEDMVIILCFHGLKHSWQNLNWLSDITYMILNHPDIKWHNLFVHAGTLGLKRIVLVGLLLARDYGGIRCGSEIENLFTLDPAILNLAEEIQLNLFPSESSLINPFFFLKSRERIKDKIMFLFYFLVYIGLLLPGWALQKIKK